MKQIIKNYAFNKTAQTVSFSDFASISLDRLLLITNVTANVVIYQFNDPALGGSVSGNVLTLTLDTSSMHNTDKLQVIYDCATGDPVYDASSTTGAVAGDVASGTADAGFPVKAGGVYHSSPPAFANGQRGDLQIDSQGRLLVNTAALAATVDSVSTQGLWTELSGLTAAVLNADLVPSTDVSAYKWLSLQILGVYTGTITFQGSNDGSSWKSVVLKDIGTASNPTITTFGNTAPTSANALFAGPIDFRFFRARLTSYTNGSGTASGILELYAVAPGPQGQINLAGGVLGSADGLNNPTTSAIWSYGLVYNGTTFDRHRAANAASNTTGTGLAGVGLLGFDGTNYQRVKVTTAGLLQNGASQTAQTLTAGSSTGSSTASALTGLSPYREALITLNCTAASGTAPTLTVRIQASDDGGTTWYDLPNAAFTQLTATGVQTLCLGMPNNSFGDTVRAAWTIGGTAPSFTFTVKGLFKT